MNKSFTQFNPKETVVDALLGIIAVPIIIVLTIVIGTYTIGSAARAITSDFLTFE